MIAPVFLPVFIMADDAAQTAKEIADGLKRLGANRVVALSVHKSKELIAELEEKAARLVQQLESSR